MNNYMGRPIYAPTLWTCGVEHFTYPLQRGVTHLHLISGSSTAHNPVIWKCTINIYFKSHERVLLTYSNSLNINKVSQFLILFRSLLTPLINTDAET